MNVDDLLSYNLVASPFDEVKYLAVLSNLKKLHKIRPKYEDHIDHVIYNLQSYYSFNAIFEFAGETRKMVKPEAKSLFIIDNKFEEIESIMTKTNLTMNDVLLKMEWTEDVYFEVKYNVIELSTQDREKLYNLVKGKDM